jgi:hypothetical protein
MPALHAWHYVLDVKGRSLQRLVHLAILAPPASPRRYELTSLVCHRLLALRFAAK